MLLFIIIFIIIIIIFIFLQEVPAEAYLVRQKKHFISNEMNTENSSTIENWSDKLCEDPYEASFKNERPLIIEHHILWSMSYSVPVLYFNGWKSGDLNCN